MIIGIFQQQKAIEEYNHLERARERGRQTEEIFAFCSFTIIAYSFEQLHRDGEIFY